MTRIVAGSARGRTLTVPAGAGTRPTSDRAREGLFSTLAGLADLGGSRVLDLYAGSGALGLEALSRGAVHALLVDDAAAAVAAAAANAAALDLGGAEVRKARVERLAAAVPPGPAYDVIFADPPYLLAAADLAAVLRGVLAYGWLAPGAVVVVERATRDAAWVWPEPFVAERQRRYGETTLWYGRAP